MKPSAPTKPFWILGLVFGVLGILGHFVAAGFLTTNSFYFLLAGFLLLALGTSFRGV